MNQGVGLRSPGLRSSFTIESQPLLVNHKLLGLHGSSTVLSGPLRSKLKDTALSTILLRVTLLPPACPQGKATLFQLKFLCLSSSSTSSPFPRHCLCARTCVDAYHRPLSHCLAITLCWGNFPFLCLYSICASLLRLHF